MLAGENGAFGKGGDISHSSVERVIAPDSSILADYALARLNGLLEGLEVFPKRMQENLHQLKGVIFSQRVLIALMEAGLSRDEGYEIVQKKALEALDRGVQFLDLLKAETKVTKLLKGAELESLFDPSHFLKNIDYLYKKVLG